MSWSPLSFLISVIITQGYIFKSGDLELGTGDEGQHGAIVFLDLGYHTQYDVF